MKAWLISVTAVCLLLVLLELIMGEGNTKKYISGFLRLAIIIVLISPVITLIKNDNYETYLTDLTAFNSDGNDTVYENFSSQLYLKTQLEAIIEEKLNNRGGNCTVKVEIADNKIKSVAVTVNKNGINESNENIYTIENIRNDIEKLITIDREKIFVYGAE